MGWNDLRMFCSQNPVPILPILIQVFLVVPLLLQKWNEWMDQVYKLFINRNLQWSKYFLAFISICNLQNTIGKWFYSDHKNLCGFTPLSNWHNEVKLRSNHIRRHKITTRSLFRPCLSSHLAPYLNLSSWPTSSFPSLSVFLSSLHLPPHGLLPPLYLQLSFIVRIVPSPDWFVGVDSVDLCDGDQWKENVSLELFPYDAGTDSGFTFSSPNFETIPQDKITQVGQPQPSATSITPKPLLSSEKHWCENCSPLNTQCKNRVLTTYSLLFLVHIPSIDHLFLP